ncbi:MAG: 2-hydroxyacyl-CoA dehydratase [Nitrospinae bacterium]|nr:2-hydroxyacyl-CoA dehydratase [Nitrospinota bacterium]
MSKERDLMESVVASFEQRLNYRRAHPAAKSKELYVQAMKDYFEMVLRAKEEGKHLAWTSFAVPVELFYAMDTVPFLVEQFCITDLVQRIAQGQGLEYFDIGAGTGFSTETCSPHLATVGMAKDGALPKPDFIIGANSPCDSGLVAFYVLNSLYQCPSFYLDYPYLAGEEAIRYFKRDLERMVKFLEEQTGKKMDYDRLREVMKSSGKAHNDYLKTMQLRKATPAPFGGREAFSLMTIKIYTEGLPQTTEFFETLYRENQEKVDRGEGVLADERHRIAWFGGYPFFFTRITDWMEENFQTVVVGDGLCLIPNTPVEDLSDPLECLARKNMGASYWKITRSFCHVAEDLGDLSKEFGIDGAVFFASLGCKQNGGQMRMFQDVWREKLGIPTLILDGDVMDPRVVSAEQMKVRLREFFPLLETSKSSRLSPVVV